MNIKSLRQKVLSLAISGKLVSQNKKDEPASFLLEKIKKEKEELIKQKKIKQDKNETEIIRGEDNSYYEKFPDGTLKNIDDEIPFELPEGWSFERLCKFCWLSNGETKTNEKNIYWDVKTLRNEKEPTTLQSGNFVLENTKVILVDGENSGEVFTIPSKGYMGSTFRILETVNEIEEDYLKLILNFYKPLFKGNKTGSAIPHLNKNIFKTLIIPLPPLSEQKRIVERVEEIFSLIDILEKNI